MRERKAGRRGAGRRKRPPFELGMAHLLGEAMRRERVVRDGTGEGDFAYALGIGRIPAEPRQGPRVEIHEADEIATWHERPAEEREPVVCLHLGESGGRIQWQVWPAGCLPKAVEDYLHGHPTELGECLAWMAGRAGVSWGQVMEAIGSGRWVLFFGLEAWFEVFLAERFPEKAQEWDRVWCEALPTRVEPIRLTPEGEEFQCLLVDSDADPEMAGRLPRRLLLAWTGMLGSHPAARALRQARPRAHPDWVSLCWIARVAHGGEGENRWRLALLCLEKADLLYVQTHSRERPEQEIADEMKRLARVLHRKLLFRKAYRLLGDRPQAADREDLQAEARLAGWERMGRYDLFRLRTKMSNYLVNAMAAAAFAWATERLTRHGQESDGAETEEMAAATEADRRARAQARAELERRLAGSGLSAEHRRLVLAVGERVAEGMSERAACEQIARRLGLSGDATRKRYQRAVAKLTGMGARVPRARPKAGKTRR